MLVMITNKTVLSLMRSLKLRRWYIFTLEDIITTFFPYKIDIVIIQRCSRGCKLIISREFLLIIGSQFIHDFKQMMFVCAHIVFE